jgi:hypothetical protein
MFLSEYHTNLLSVNEMQSRNTDRTVRCLLPQAAFHSSYKPWPPAQFPAHNAARIKHVMLRFSRQWRYRYWDHLTVCCCEKLACNYKSTWFYWLREDQHWYFKHATCWSLVLFGQRLLMLNMTWIKQPTYSISVSEYTRANYWSSYRLL